MTSQSIQSPAEGTANRDKRWRKTKSLVVVLILAGLASLNIVTLLNAHAHEKAYGLLEDIGKRALSESVADRVFRKSPVAVRREAVAVATRPLHAANNDLVLKNRKLSLDRERLASSTLALVGKTQDLTVATNKLATSTSTLVIEAAALSRERAALGGTILAMKNTAENQRAAVRHFSTRLAARSARNAARNVVSIPGKTLPFVGTGIIVAATAWDLQDLCEALKDMNALNAALGNEQEDLTKVCGIPIPTAENVLTQARANWRQAYHTAAIAVRGAGEALPALAPTVPWSEAKKTVCPVVEPIPAGCGN